MACLGCVSLFWLVLFFIQYAREVKHYFISNVLLVLCIFFILFIFLLHKSNIDHHSFFSLGYSIYEKYAHLQHIVIVLSSLTFSYIFLRAIDLIRAIKARNPILDPFSLLGYLIPFYMIASGPVNVYTEYVAANERESPSPNFSLLLESINLITNGLFLKFVCAEGLRILVFGLNGKLESTDIFSTAFIFIYVFFDFAGYSYVAFGIGKLLGIPTPLNFQHPYVSKSVTEFWTRWHVSLGDFVKRTIFVPLQVFMVRKWGVGYAYRTNLIALIASFVFVGIWHRLSLKFIIWGIMVGCIVALEKIIRDQLNNKKIFSFLKFKGPGKILASILGPCYVFCVIVGTLHFAIQDLLGQ